MAINNLLDVIDSRDIIKQISELEDELQDLTEKVVSELEGWKNLEQELADLLAKGLLDRSGELQTKIKEAREAYEITAIDFKEWNDDNLDELNALKSVESECGGSEWGLTLIREDYFEDYCQELCKDIGDLPKNLPSYIVIDWEATANNLRADYREVDYDGVSYLYRN